MNDTTAKGTLDKITGNLTGDAEFENKGKVEQIKGNAEQAAGHTKDAEHAVGSSIGKVADKLSD